MRTTLNLITIGKVTEPWIKQGMDFYQTRLPHELELQLTEIPTPKRQKSIPLARTIEREGDMMLAAIPKGALVITLDEHGHQWSSEALSKQLQAWREQNNSICMLIGGPDGLAPKARQAAQLSWSLSKLTLPHALVRVFVAEQLYRAWTISNNHPYHRA